MTTSTDRDLALKTDIEDELEWTPDVDAAGIGVAVEDGAVTLSGEVDTYPERLAAKNAALRVRGVRTLVDNLEVHPRASWPVTETDIAKEVERALRHATNVPDSVQAVVEGHSVTLRGEVEWEYQRMAAKGAVQYLRGVFTVHNLITLRERPTAADTEQRIRAAWTRSALIDASSVHVEVEGGKVILTGTVSSWAEKSEAAAAAWSSPHVTAVDNRLVVEHR